MSHHSVTLKTISLIGLLFAFGLPAAAAGDAADEGSITVSLSRKKAGRGERVEVTIRPPGGPSGGTVRALLLKPTVGPEELPVRAVPGQGGLYRAEVTP